MKRFKFVQIVKAAIMNCSRIPGKKAFPYVYTPALVYSLCAEGNS